MAESIQHKLDRVRPPRVQITYDLEIGDAIEMRELPFVVGIMADLSGDRDPDIDVRPVAERKFVEVDRDNFNDIMEDISPRLAFRVDNKLTDESDDSQLSMVLNFKTLDDFDPVSVVRQVPAMAKLYDARTRLRDLLAKLDGNDNLERMLQDIVQNTDKQQEVRKNIEDAAKADAAASGEDEDPKPKSGKQGQ